MAPTRFLISFENDILILIILVMLRQIPFLVIISHHFRSIFAMPFLWPLLSLNPDPDRDLSLQL